MGSWTGDEPECTPSNKCQIFCYSSTKFLAESGQLPKLTAMGAVKKKSNSKAKSASVKAKKKSVPDVKKVLVSSLRSLKKTVKQKNANKKPNESKQKANNKKSSVTNKKVESDSSDEEIKDQKKKSGYEKTASEKS